MADQGIGNAASSGATTTIVITTTQTVTVGQMIAVGATCYHATFAPASAVDSAGNTYSLDKTQRDTADANFIGGLLSAPCTTQLSSGGTITVTYSGSAPFKLATAAALDNADPAAGRVDVTQSKINDSVQTWDTGNATTGNANDILIGFAAQINGTVSDTPGGSNTELSDFASGSDTVTLLFRRVTSTGSYNVDGSWSAALGMDCVAILGAYKSSGGAGPEAARDFMRGAFPFLVGGQKLRGGDTQSSAPAMSGGLIGPAAMGGFERFMFSRLHPVFPVAAVLPPLPTVVDTAVSQAANN